MEFEKAQQSLFFAVAFFDQQPKKSTSIIRVAIADGANINGHNDSGETPLAAAIDGGVGSPAAVALLLELGANPNVRNQDGYTPWSICLERMGDPGVSDKMKKIQKMLAPHVEDRTDEKIAELEQAINNREIKTIEFLLESMNPLSVATFDPLTFAVDTGNLEITKLLLQKGYEVGRNKRNEPMAFYPAIRGDRAMIELLLAHGADLQAYADDDPELTCEAVARMNDHIELADWLKDQIQAGKQ
jgi:ankyrin repeat protein